MKAVVIGCGRIGSEYDEDSKRKVISSHAGAYFNNPEVELVGVCDLDKAKAEKAAAKWNTKAYFDVDEMLEKEKPDLISICTWENTHAEILGKCVKHKPKAIWCEKPIAKTVEEAKKMIELCDGIKLQVNYMRRFSPLYREVAEFLKSGGIGKIQKITGHYGDGLMTNGSHLINLAQFFVDEDFINIKSIKSALKSRYEHDVNYAFVAESESGILFSLTPQNNENYLHMELQIFGEKGAIFFTRSGFEIKYFEVKEHELFSGFKELVECPAPFKNKISGEFMKEALDELISDGKPICSGEDALKTLEFVSFCINN
jgi:predicted dehydrogenase